MTKTLMIATVLTLGTTLPTLSMAACAGHKEQQAMTCAEGSTWDAETATCTPIASS
jgi:hypothetical protein